MLLSCLLFSTEAVIPETVWEIFGDKSACYNVEHNVGYTHMGFLRITTSHNVLFCFATVRSK